MAWLPRRGFRQPRHANLDGLVAQLTIAWFAGARFDIMLSQLRQGKFSRPDPAEADKLREAYDRNEL